MRTSTEHLERLLLERHQAVKSSFENLLVAISTNERVTVQGANRDFLNALVNLSHALAREHWPNWLTELMAHANNYKVNFENGPATWIGHLKVLIDHRNSLENHVWFNDSDEKPAFDVDQLIEAARREFKIEELYDRIILILRELAACEDLDSSKAIHDLETVITTLQKAKVGSLSSQLATWQFVRKFVPNLLDCYLRKSKLAGPAIEAFEKTAAELDVNLDKTKRQIFENLQLAACSAFKSQATDLIAAFEIRSISESTAQAPSAEL